MFKVSIPAAKVKACQTWYEFFDLFCQSEKDEDILEEYSLILEGQEAFLLERLNGNSISVDDHAVIIQGSKDHRSISVAVRANPDSKPVELFVMYKNTTLTRGA